MELLSQICLICFKKHTLQLQIVVRAHLLDEVRARFPLISEKLLHKLKWRVQKRKEQKIIKKIKIEFIIYTPRFVVIPTR